MLGVAKADLADQPAYLNRTAVSLGSSSPATRITFAIGTTGHTFEGHLDRAGLAACITSIIWRHDASDKVFAPYSLCSVKK